MLALVSPTPPTHTVVNLFSSAIQEFWFPLLFSGIYIVLAAWRRKRLPTRLSAPRRFRGLPVPILVMALWTHLVLFEELTFAGATQEWIFYWAAVGTFAMVLVWIGLLFAWRGELHGRGVPPFAWVSAVVVTLNALVDFSLPWLLMSLFSVRLSCLLAGPLRGTWPPRGPRWW